MAQFLQAITKRRKTPEQLVRLASKALEDILSPSAGAELAVVSPVGVSGGDLARQPSDAEASLCKRLAQMKDLLYGDSEKTPDEDKAQELAQLLMHEGLLVQLVQNLSALPFEARKDTAQIFNNIVRKDLAGFASYIEQNFHVVHMLIDGYNQPDIALNCGSMIRECIRHEGILRSILYSDTDFWLFFERFVHIPSFDVASDAFTTLRDLLTRKKSVASEFLEQKYDQVFTAYQGLLNSENYVTRRQSLKLLGELLLDRSNFGVMMRYISSKENLKLIMNLLRDKSPNIQFEAFHVFKVFVANPKKPPEIVTILYKNQDKLIAYLESFHSDKDDPQFNEEKALLINTLSALEAPEGYIARRDSNLTSEEAPTPTLDLPSPTSPAGLDSKQT
jgi:calcium binding protein 39